MELVFERVGAGPASSARFTARGGVIGRAADCDWVIADSKRVISGRHARVTHRDGDYFLTDTSSNGIRLKDNGASLIVQVRSAGDVLKRGDRVVLLEHLKIDNAYRVALDTDFQGD